MGARVPRAGHAALVLCPHSADRAPGQHQFGALPAGDDAGCPVIAQLVQADEDTVRDVIHRFNEIGPARLDPQWAGGRPANSAMTTRISSSRGPPHDRSARSTRYQWPVPAVSRDRGLGSRRRAYGQVYPADREMGSHTD